MNGVMYEWDHLWHDAAHCNTLQHAATHSHVKYAWVMSCTICDMTLHAAAHCNTLQHTATHCNTQPCQICMSDVMYEWVICDMTLHTATHCNALQRTATHCNTLQHTATHYNTLLHTATHESAVTWTLWTLYIVNRVASLLLKISRTCSTSSCDAHRTQYVATNWRTSGWFHGARVRGWGCAACSNCCHAGQTARIQGVLLCSCIYDMCCSVLQCVAVCCSVLQCVAACCSVLQCDAVCCSVLQCDLAHAYMIWLFRMYKKHVAQQKCCTSKMLHNKNVAVCPLCRVRGSNSRCLTLLMHMWYDSCVCGLTYLYFQRVWLVASRTNESRHVCMSHVTYQWVVSCMTVTSHMNLVMWRNVTWLIHRVMNESCHMDVCDMTHSYVKQRIHMFDLRDRIHSSICCRLPLSIYSYVATCPMNESYHIGYMWRYSSVWHNQCGFIHSYVAASPMIWLMYMWHDSFTCSTYVWQLIHMLPLARRAGHATPIQGVWHVLQCVAVCCSVLQCVAARMKQGTLVLFTHLMTWGKTRPFVWHVLQCVAVCCNVSWYECCSVL